jgi:hypothetical protein
LQLPWAYTFVAGVTCSVLVAGVSMNWSEAKTQSWLVATGLSLLWKLFVFDMLKAMFCGQVLEPLFTVSSPGRVCHSALIFI